MLMRSPIVFKDITLEKLCRFFDLIVENPGNPFLQK